MANIFGNVLIRDGARIGKTYAGRIWGTALVEDRVIACALLPDNFVEKSKDAEVANNLGALQTYLIKNVNMSVAARLFERVEELFESGAFYTFRAPYYVSSALCSLHSFKEKPFREYVHTKGFECEDVDDLGKGSTVYMRIFAPDGTLLNEVSDDDCIVDEANKLVSFKYRGKFYDPEELIVYRIDRANDMVFTGFVGAKFWTRSGKITFKGVPYIKASEGASPLPKGYVNASNQNGSRRSNFDARTSVSDMIVYSSANDEGMSFPFVYPVNPLISIFRMNRCIVDSLGATPLTGGGGTLPMGLSGGFVDAINSSNDGDGLFIYAPKKSNKSGVDPLDQISLENAVDGIVLVADCVRKRDGARESNSVNLDDVVVTDYNTDKFLSEHSVYVTSRQTGDRNAVWVYVLVGTPSRESVGWYLRKLLPSTVVNMFSATEKVVMSVGSRACVFRALDVELEVVINYSDCSVLVNGSRHGDANMKLTGKYDELFRLSPTEITHLDFSNWSIGVDLGGKKHGSVSQPKRRGSISSENVLVSW